VLLTAAGQGIGRATALAFAREGAAVWPTDVNQTTLGTLAVEYSQIRTRTIHVRDTPGIETLVAEVGKIDVLFNCAGYVHHGTILDCSVEDWNFSTDLNLKSMYRTCTSYPIHIPSGGNQSFWSSTERLGTYPDQSDCTKSLGIESIIYYRELSL